MCIILMTMYYSLQYIMLIISAFLKQNNSHICTLQLLKLLFYFELLQRNPWDTE